MLAYKNLLQKEMFSFINLKGGTLAWGLGEKGTRLPNWDLTSYWFYRIITHLFQTQSVNTVELQITADNSLKYRQRRHEYVTIHSNKMAFFFLLPKWEERMKMSFWLFLDQKLNVQQKGKFSNAFWHKYIHFIFEKWFRMKSWLLQNQYQLILNINMGSLYFTGP